MRHGQGQRARGRRPALVAFAVLATAITSAGIGHAADAEGTGTASVIVTPLALEAANLVDDLDVALGALEVMATTEPLPGAQLTLDGVGVQGVGLPSWDRDTSAGDQTGDASVSLDESGVAAAVDLLEWVVEADSTRAHAGLSGLGATASAAPLALAIELDAQDIAATVEPTTATGVISIDIAAISIGLGDLLPSEVVDGLPLGAVLELVDRLDLSLPEAVQDQVGDLDDLLATIDAVLPARVSLDDAQGELLDVLADLSLGALPDTSAIDAAIDALAAAQLDLAGAEAALVDAEDGADDLVVAIAAVESEIAGLEDALDLLTISQLAQRLLLEGEIAALTTTLGELEAELIALQGTIPDLEDDVSDAATAVTAAQAALDLLTGPATAALAPVLTSIDAATAALEALLEELATRLAAIDVEQLRLDLLDVVREPLLELGVVALQLTTTADATGGTGEVTCDVAGARVLGTVVPTPTCAAIEGVLTTLADAIEEAFRVLQDLPDAGLVPSVDSTPFGVVESGLTDPDGDGRTASSAEVVPLSLGVPSLALVDLADTTIASLDAAIVAAGFDDIASIVSVDGLDDLVVPAGLDAALAGFGADLDALPAGDTLGGLATRGVSLTVGAVSAQTTFAPLAVDTGGGGGDDATDEPADPDEPVRPDGPDDPDVGGEAEEPDGEGAEPGTPVSAFQPAAPPPDTEAGPTPMDAPDLPRGRLPVTGDRSIELLAVALLAIVAGAATLQAGHPGVRRPRDRRSADRNALAR